MPFTAAASAGLIFMLYTLPWKLQTPWAMVCVTVIGTVAMGLAYLDDIPEEDGDDDSAG